MSTKLLRGAITALFACVLIVTSGKSSNTPEPVSLSGDTLRSYPGNAGIFVSDPGPLCSSHTLQYWVYIEGCDGPYTIKLLISGQYYTFISTTTPFILNWPPADIWLLSVTTPTCNNITIDQPNHLFIQVLPQLTAAFSPGDLQVCPGGAGTDLVVNFSNNDVHTFTYKINNVVQPPITTAANPYLLHVNPTVNTTYTLNDVAGPVCPGTVNPPPVTVSVISPPGATMAGDMTFCNRADTAFLVDFTGPGPYQLTYAIDGVTQSPLSTADNPFRLPVHTDSSAVYSLISVQNSACSGPASGLGNIEILSTPIDSNLQVHCNPVDNLYIVEFDIVNAAGPVTIISGAGTLTGYHFVSAPIHQLQPYAFVFHDSIHCKDVTVSGLSGCSCVSYADTMALADTLRACVGTVITAVYNGAPVLDGDDSLRFILHTRADSIGQVLAWNDAPEFSFQPGMHGDSVYYISAIAGDYVAGDSIDLADICLSIAPGTPVVFMSLPEAVFGSDQTICAGTTVVLPVSLSGAPPWSIEYAVNGIPQSTIGPVYNSPLSLILNLTDTSVITLTHLSDTRCSNQPADNALITVNSAPQTGDPTFDCDVFTSTYTVSFDILAGLAPWVITGTPGTMNGNLFTSLPIDSGQPYSISLSDDNLCGATVLSDTFTCPCATEAGAMDPALIELCAGAIAHATHNGAEFLDSSDNLEFVLHTGAGPGLGIIFARSASPDFGFDPASMQYGQIYYVVAIAGNAGPGGNVDLTDPCLSVSPATPVIWHATPTATLAGAVDICPGETPSINIVFTGTAPFTFDYTENGFPQTLISSSVNYLLNSTPVQSIGFVPVSVQDAHCPGTVSGHADITLHTIPEILNPVQVCNPDNLHFSVSFDVHNGDAATTNVVSALGGNFDPATGHFTSVEGDLPNTYTFYVSDGWQCGQDTLVVMPDCSCTTDAGTIGPGQLTLCPGQTADAPYAADAALDNNDLLVFILHTNPAPGIGTILATAAAPSFQFDAVSMQYGITYYISGVAGNALAGNGLNWSDPCLSLTNSMPVVWHDAPTATLSGDFDICPGQSQDLVISLTGQAPFTVDYTENGVPHTLVSAANLYTLQTALTQSGTFTLVNVQDGNCPGTASGQTNIAVHGAPEIVNAVQVCDPDNLHYTVAFDVINGDQASLLVNSALGGNFDPVSGHFSSQPALLPQPVSFIVSDVWQCGEPVLNWTPDCACTTNAGQIDQAPMNVCAGSDIQFPAATGQVLDGFDAAQYVLCTDPANLPQSILFQSATPQFASSPGLLPGTTYFVMALAGNPAAGGTPDFNDPCLSVSTPVPVVIHPLPVAAIDGDTLICRGSDFVIPVLLSGSAPFTFQFSIDGAPQSALITSLNTFPIAVHNLQQGQVFELHTIEDQYCTGTATGTFSLGIRELPAVTLSGFDSICPGGTAVLTVDLQNAGHANFDLRATPGGSGHFVLSGNGLTIPVMPTQTTVYTLENVKVDDNGCPPLAGGTARVDLAPVDVSIVAGDYNGVGISCFGANDGYAGASVSGGFNPVTIVWSTGDDDIDIIDLSPGVYAVTVTDLEGCTAVADVFITEPEPLSAAWTASDIDCRPGSSGAIHISAVQDGVGPYRIQINGEPDIPLGTLPQNIDGLTAGPLEVIVRDANGCVVSAFDTIYEPVLPGVDLGPDIELIAGDSVLLTGMLSGNPPVSWTWSPAETLLTPALLSTIAVPKQTTTYTLTIEDAAGCTATDAVTLSFLKTRRIYIPNVIKEGAARDNDVFTVYGGPEVWQINYMGIYDRWGEHLFVARNFLPNDPQAGWDGSYKGRPMPPGVYVYLIEIAFLDGKTEVFKGEVTVVR